MKVVIIRHGKVNYSWSKWCTSIEYDKECIEYDNAPIINKSYKMPYNGYKNIYISSLPRSRSTAEILFSNEDFRKTELIDEVPLKSCFDTRIRLPVWFWNTSARIQWLFNRSRQPEGRFHTMKRAKLFVDKLCKEDVDSAVVTHGFYMHILLREMKKAGFKIDKAHIYYKNGECIMTER